MFVRVKVKKGSVVPVWRESETGTSRLYLQLIVIEYWYRHFLDGSLLSKRLCVVLLCYREDTPCPNQYFVSRATDDIVSLKQSHLIEAGEALVEQGITSSPRGEAALTGEGF